jgi:hypothetical protein
MIGGLSAANLSKLKQELLALELFWSDQVRFQSRLIGQKKRGKIAHGEICGLETIGH